MNCPPDRFGGEDFPLGPEDSELDALAHTWAELPPEAEPPESLSAAFALASIESVIDALASPALARERGQEHLADAYVRVCRHLITK